MVKVSSTHLFGDVFQPDGHVSRTFDQRPPHFSSFPKSLTIQWLRNQPLEQSLVRQIKGCMPGASQNKEEPLSPHMVGVQPQICPKQKAQKAKSKPPPDMVGVQPLPLKSSFLEVSRPRKPPRPGASGARPGAGGSGLGRSF